MFKYKLKGSKDLIGAFLKRSIKVDSHEEFIYPFTQSLVYKGMPLYDLDGNVLKRNKDCDEIDFGVQEFIFSKNEFADVLIRDANEPFESRYHVQMELDMLSRANLILYVSTFAIGQRLFDRIRKENSK